jgi:hypothetical protein
MDHESMAAEIQALLTSLKSSLSGSAEVSNAVESLSTDSDGLSRQRLPQDFLPDHRALRRFQLMV